MTTRTAVVQRERRVLMVTIGVTMLGTVLMIVSVNANDWVLLTLNEPSYRNASRSYVVSQKSGLFRICRNEYDNSSLPSVEREFCKVFKFFPSANNIAKDREVDEHIINYRRSQTAFAVIALVLMFLAQAFAIYSLYEPRYMFKRVAGMMHLMAAGAVFISGEVFIQSVGYEEDHLRARYPRGATHHFGYAFAFAIITTIIYIAAGIMFFVYGRKRKGEKAATEEEAMENEPVIIGRA